MTTAHICTHCGKEKETIKKPIRVCGTCGEPVGSHTICDGAYDNCESVTWCFNCEDNAEGNTMTEEEYAEKTCIGCDLPNSCCKCNEANNLADEYMEQQAGL